MDSDNSKLEVMVDIETLGNGNKAAIMSIGAVLFDPRGQGIDGMFHMAVDPADSVRHGLVMDANTVLWWMNPKQDAGRVAMIEAQQQCAMPLGDALFRLAGFIGAARPVWGNGATFDSVIVRNAYQLVGLPCPWSFWNDRCYRTLKSLAPDVKMQRVGTHHSAVDDAATQALHLQAIFAHISGGK